MNGTFYIFDIFSIPEGMHLYCIDEHGNKTSLIDKYFVPSFYVYNKKQNYDSVRKFLDKSEIHFSTRMIIREDITEHRKISVLEVSIHQVNAFEYVARKLTRTVKDCSYFNIDVPVEQIYFYEKRLFPMAHCKITYSPEKYITHMKVLSGLWDTDFNLPPLNVMRLSLVDQLTDPRHGQHGALEVTINDQQYSYLLDTLDDPVIIDSINHHLQKEDIDIILTRWGDSFIFPHLLAISKKHNKPLLLNRIIDNEIAHSDKRSFFQYGKMVYQSGTYFCKGRWHIDMKNSFLFTESDLDGLFEVARITQTPMQQSARNTIGTCLSSMQLSTAYKRNVLIPYRKHIPETPKTALELLNADKGGLVYQPLTGFWNNVGEIDFASMYPTIMVNFNISPETINCPCCPDAPRVPEIGYRICKKQGLVPETLAPMLTKRLEYKKLQKSSPDEHIRAMAKGRQGAMKWLLVTCFGYLGYKNARFGRIEAHESVTAFGREILLTAKEISEDSGFRMLNANVDSLYVTKQNVHENSYQNLADKIAHITGMPVGLEGVYKWVGFLPSKRDSEMSVQNRYFGAFKNGEIKVRGIEIRRHDTPRFIKQYQEEIVAKMVTAQNVQEIETFLPAILLHTLDVVDSLKSGEIELKDLSVRKHLSRMPQEYLAPTWTAIVGQELLSRGIQLHPGEGVEMILTDMKSKVHANRVRSLAFFDPTFHHPDIEKYIDMLFESCDSLLSWFGLTTESLREYVKEKAKQEQQEQLMFKHLSIQPAPGSLTTVPSADR